MIAGIGVDTIEICRVERAVLKEAFVQKIYTLQEIEYCEGKGKNKAQSYAGIFAAKEAAVKALGSGFRGICPKSVEIWHDLSGVPHLRFLDEALDTAKQLQIAETHISISHDQTKAVAFVILETRRR